MADTDDQTSRLWWDSDEDPSSAPFEPNRRHANRLTRWIGSNQAINSPLTVLRGTQLEGVDPAFSIPSLHAMSEAALIVHLVDQFGSTPST